MFKIFNTILLSTVLIFCSNSQSTCIYNPLYDLGGKIVTDSQYKVDDISSSPYFGQIYFQKSGDSKQYLIDEEGRPFFDLETVIQEVNTSAPPKKGQIPYFMKSGKWNLIIKQNASYTITGNEVKLPCNTNLIIPVGTTLISTNTCIGFSGIGGCNVLVFWYIKFRNTVCNRFRWLGKG